MDWAVAYWITKRISPTAFVIAWPIRSKRVRCSIRCCPRAIKARDRAEQFVRVEQAERDDIPRVRDLVRQDQLAQPRPDLSLLNIVNDRVPSGMKDPEKSALFLTRHAFFDQPLQRDSATRQQVSSARRQDRLLGQNPRDLLGRNRERAGLGRRRRHGLPRAGRCVRLPIARAARDGCRSPRLSRRLERREPAAIMKAEEISRCAGLHFDKLFERQTRPARAVAAPMRQHEAGNAGIDDRAAMRAAVPQAQQRRRIGQHLADRAVIADED